MIFLSGSTFFGGEIMSVPCTPTNLNNITKVEISNTIVDDFYVTKNMDTKKIEENTIPSEWDWDTIMHAPFDDDTFAGNVNWHLEELSGFVIKVKPEEQYRWITCYVKKVYNYEDLYAIGRYLAATTGNWDVALVPITKGNKEGTYVQTSVDVNVNKLVLIDVDGVHSTFLTDGSLSMQSVMPNQAVDTLHNKYPYIIRNTVANYETVNVTATFLPNNEECIVDDMDTRYFARWNRELKAWIMNGRTKILKSEDGDMWLGYITTPVSDQPYDNGVTEYRKLSFGLTETGHPLKEKDLFEAGLIDSSVTSDWWSD